jgi:hypothetical protein
LCPHTRRLLAREVCTDPRLEVSLYVYGANLKTYTSVVKPATHQSLLDFLLQTPCMHRQVSAYMGLLLTSKYSGSGCPNLLGTYYSYLASIRTCLINWLCTCSVADLRDLIHKFVRQFTEIYKLFPCLWRVKSKDHFEKGKPLLVQA